MDNSTAILDPLPDDIPVTTHTANPTVAFIIGLAIVLLASVLNAAGLNLTKLDHVRTSAIPKAARRKDWLRPLWLLGMLLYILSQLIGSTLALEYMRAEYVAPLGSSSLIFNFLFARFLVGTPVTSNDIYGTVVVILGVVGIVAFGSINSGLAAETDVAHLTYLWRRGGWLGYFFAMSFALILLLIFTSCLDAILTARSDIQALPFSGMNVSRQRTSQNSPLLQKLGRAGRVILWLRETWCAIIGRVTELLETWSAPKDDKQVAWTLGIGWACCGGGLAGGCLVFAKVIVQLLSGSLTHQNPGNQFGHVAPIFTIILLSVTAVLQIICLNRGLKVYDSTLVVPVFYGVYTATGFLNSLIFNNEVDAYQSWTLFLIFVSILVLISGVVLLTHKKPEPVTNKIKSSTLPRRRTKANLSKTKLAEDDEEEQEGEDQVLWAVGEGSDREGDEDEDEDIDHHQHPLYQQREHQTRTAHRADGRANNNRGSGEGGSGRPSMDPFGDDHEAEMERLQ
ncbi:hypothetical protein P691DRAFT_810345 [Macrolepiota fuliginosa MF-IS2]|uniref:Uncharacterized protein n=1 Tax=Macrolepiota fuliginosa MF-IS2 TaxID=1400762 RepID=A0A9P5XHE2_9AGAR|nr:hypothetical protein P691DRAFT_810345 [Macrolepiota fuliginosa MF-IS2]